MTKQAENIIVGISIGDLNGIGSEVVLKTFEDSRILELCTPLIFANVKTISFLKKYLNLTTNFNGIDKIEQLIKGKINVLNVWRDTVNINFGKTDTEVGKYAILSFKEATQALKDDKIDVLITAPINKANIQSDDFKFPGHTDYLNQELDGEALMLMVNGALKVGLVTEHIALQEVSKHLSEKLLIEKAKQLSQTLKQDFAIVKPKIAVLGLNPHCGDHGVIGTEDETLIKPALKKLFDEKIMVFGPFAADGFFGSDEYTKYDAILAMYHDQGLIPFKTLSFGQGVNFTAGLNKIRTSPDHGTAFEIAGKNQANHQSFTEALYTAIDIFNNRNEYLEASQNPLQHISKKGS